MADGCKGHSDHSDHHKAATATASFLLGLVQGVWIRYWMFPVLSWTFNVRVAASISRAVLHIHSKILMPGAAPVMFVGL